MINIGTRIGDYVIIAIANGYALAANSIATSDFVVWKVERERIGVCEERRFNNLMDAEWEFCSLAFEWFQDNVLISDEEDEEYKRSSAEARVEVLEENLSAAHRSLAAAMDLVEELILEHERLCPKEDRVTDEPIEKVAREFAETFANMQSGSLISLKTCPFCGSARLRLEPPDVCTRNIPIKIICKDCNGAIEQDDIVKAAAAWNRRNANV